MSNQPSCEPRRQPGDDSANSSDHASASPAIGPDQDLTPFGVETLAFRASRIARLTAEAGWLTLVGRFPLEHGENRLPIGVVTVAERGAVTLAVSPGLVVTCDGSPVGAGHERQLRSDSDEGGPDRIIHGRLIYELIRRGDVHAMRVRDPESPRRREFRGTDWYPVRPDWRIQARYEPFASEELIPIPYDFGPVLTRSPGRLALEMCGATWRLDTLMDDERKRLFILFGDASNRDQTYGAGRFLYTAALPDLATGHVVVDFNRALNPACAFTEFASCPLPPPQNRLPFPVEAGEKRYLDH
jgi:uncharacterized protein (DUF1684 family)